MTYGTNAYCTHLRIANDSLMGAVGPAHSLIPSLENEDALRALAAQAQIAADNYTQALAALREMKRG